MLHRLVGRGKLRVVSLLEESEGAVRRLSLKEAAAFRLQLGELDAAAWDRRIKN